MVDSSVVDWQPHISKEVLDSNQNLKILEFGLGFGTEIFLNKGHSVHSVEILSSQQDKNWFNNMTNKYAGKSWRGSFLQIQGEIDDIERNERVKGLFDIKKSPMIQDTLRGIVAPFFQEQTYDFIFVDPGIHLRPELVNLAFETNTRYIAVHDTSVGHAHYGWEFINPPPHYTNKGITYGMGVNLYVRNN